MIGIKKCFYQKYINDNEKVLLTAYRHTISRLKQHFLFLFFSALPILLLYLSLRFLYDDRVAVVSSLTSYAILLMSYFLVWRILLVRRGVVFTNERVLFFNNHLFHRDTLNIAYEKINDWEVNENWIDFLFHTGTLRLRLSQGTDDVIVYAHMVHAEKIKSILGEHASFM